MKFKKAYKILTIVVLATTVVIAIYIMLKGLGLADNLDFGAGAYFYADIPNYNEEIAPEDLKHNVPKWVFYVLFFAWGALMYALWKRIDRGREKKDSSPQN